MKNATKNPSYSKFQASRARIRGITVAELEALEAAPTFDHVQEMLDRHVERVRRLNTSHEHFFGKAG